MISKDWFPSYKSVIMGLLCDRSFIEILNHNRRLQNKIKEILNDE